jgi:hypothetical protein
LTHNSPFRIFYSPKSEFLSIVSLRYFNAAGADPELEVGEKHTPETHLIPLILDVANRKRTSISIFGSDYDTNDGTCVRDYIHVSDLALAHALAFKYLLSGNKSMCFNLSNGNDFSVLEVIKSAQEVTGREIKIEFKSRRQGDPAKIIGSPCKAKEILGWNPRYDSLNAIVETAWNWYQKINNSSFEPIDDLQKWHILELISDFKPYAMQRVSLIFPVYNEEEVLPFLFDRVRQMINGMPEFIFEVIMVNDGSQDRSLELIKQFQGQVSRFKAVDFSRNFGHQIAITAGIDFAVGGAVILMDADLQDPPELLPKFLNKWKEGYQVVYAVRKTRKGHVFKRFAYSAFYRVLQRISDIKIPWIPAIFA